MTVQQLNFRSGDKSSDWKVHDPEGLQRFYWQNNSTTIATTPTTTTETSTEVKLQEAGQDLTNEEANQVLRIEDKEINDLLANDNYPFVPQADFDVDSDEIIIRKSENENV